SGRAELAVFVHDHWQRGSATCGFCINASHKSGSLNIADANGVGFPANTSVADIDIVTARGETSPCATAQCNVVVPGCIVIERSSTVGRVAIARNISVKCPNTVSRVEAAVCVVEECLITSSCVDVTVIIVIERLHTGGGVKAASGVLIERIRTSGRIF